METFPLHHFHLVSLEKPERQIHNLNTFPFLSVDSPATQQMMSCHAKESKARSLLTDTRGCYSGNSTRCRRRLKPKGLVTHSAIGLKVCQRQAVAAAVMSVDPLCFFFFGQTRPNVESHATFYTLSDLIQCNLCVFGVWQEAATCREPRLTQRRMQTYEAYQNKPQNSN